MKKFIKSTVLAAVSVAMLSACSITMPVAATSNEVGSKVGTAKATIILSVFAFNQDASIRTAAKKGGIKRISTVDVKMTNILGIIGTYETTVTGE